MHSWINGGALLIYGQQDHIEHDSPLNEVVLISLGGPMSAKCCFVGGVVWQLSVHLLDNKQNNRTQQTHTQHTKLLLTLPQAALPSLSMASSAMDPNSCAANRGARRLVLRRATFGPLVSRLGIT
jgi:hypothetical protein